MHARLLLLLLLWATILPGCVRKAEEQRARYFWPPSERDARIEYLNFYASEANLKRDLFSSLSEVVLGVELAKPLFHRPFAVDAGFGKVVITDAGSRRVFILDLAKRTLGSVSVTSEQGKAFGFPAGVALLNGGEFLLVDSHARRVNRYDLDGQMLGFFGEGKLTRPTAIAVDRRHQRIVVVDTSAHTLALFSLDGAFLGTLGGRGTDPGNFNFPLDCDFDADGNLFVLDSMNFRVQRFNWTGTGYAYAAHFGETGSESGSFVRPKALAVSPSGHVYITDSLAHKVVIFDRDGKFLLNFGGKFVAADGKFAAGGFYMPIGIAVDEKDGIWVVDSLNRMVHHFQYLNEEYLRTHPIRPGEVAPTGLEEEK